MGWFAPPIYYIELLQAGTSDYLFLQKQIQFSFAEGQYIMYYNYKQYLLLIH